jgi:hypothetical protein
MAVTGSDGMIGTVWGAATGAASEVEERERRRKRREERIEVFILKVERKKGKEEPTELW